MDWSQHPDPLERRLDMTPPETARANAALRDYAHMGAGRDLRSLHQRYVEQYKWWKEQVAAAKAAAESGQPPSERVAVKPPTSRLNTLFDWSNTYEWQARVRRFDALQAAKEQAAYEEERLKMRKVRRDAAAGALQLSGQLLVLMQQHKMKPQRVVDADGVVHEYPPAVVGETKMKDAVSTLREAADLTRREFGDDVEQVDITSGGRPVSITEVRVHLKEGNEGGR